MKTYKLEVLNPKALSIIETLQDLKLIKVSEEPVSALRKYLADARSQAVDTPSLDEITSLVEEVRKERYDNR